MSHILYHHRIASKDGQQVHVEEIIRSFREMGHKVTLVAPSVSNEAEFGGDGGFVSKLKQKLPKALYEIMEIGYSLVVAAKLYKVLRNDDVDFIYERYNMNQPMGVIMAQLFKCPIYLEVNAPLVQERDRFSGLSLKRLAKWIENFTWKNATKVLPVTQVLAEDLITAGVKKENIQVIHNGIQSTMLAQQKQRVFMPYQPKQEIVIGFVGFMHLTCGLEKVMQVLASQSHLPLRLVCIGEGNILQSLRHETEVLRIEHQVDFKGLIDRDAVFDLVNSFDIAVLPDVTDYASPLKIFEYMLAKCLIVAPNKANIREILSDNEACLFDEGEFVKTLTIAVNNFEQLQEKRVNAFNRLAEGGFTWEHNAQEICELNNTKSSDA